MCLLIFPCSYPFTTCVGNRHVKLLHLESSFSDDEKAPGPGSPLCLDESQVYICTAIHNFSGHIQHSSPFLKTICSSIQISIKFATLPNCNTGEHSRSNTRPDSHFGASIVLLLQRRSRHEARRDRQPRRLVLIGQCKSATLRQYYHQIVGSRV